ncbi:MAG TPA: FAD:protein FMN transferase, partial [Gemmatimonadaceae bacterium]|nr:FAD:protein FMN transferase [Gemmatimonadaceae bacterium]
GAGRFAFLALVAAGGLGMGARPRDEPPRIELRRAWPVMGTLLAISVWGDPRDSVSMLAAIHASRDSVRLVDSLMSNYRRSSEISRVNDAAGDSAVHVSSQTMNVLRQARLLWRLSGGAFDPTVGPFVHAWGFDGGAARIPPSRELDSLRALVAFGDVELDTVASTVRLPRRGMSLDLGGIAKGYALDLARAALARPEIHAGMIDLGGNILVFGAAPGGGRWRLGIVHPRRNRAVLGIVELDSGAIATSGDYERFHIIGGRRYAHIIDPRSGRPARGTIAATAIGPRGVWSDGLSATLYLVGASRAMTLADSLPGIAGLVVPASDAGMIRVRLSRRAARIFVAAEGVRVARPRESR